jgi:hypothetical protein
MGMDARYDTARRWMLALIVATLIPSALPAAATAPVRVILRDGSYVQAAALPEVRGDRALLRLHPSGMLAVVPVERIDFEATVRATGSAPAGESPDARARIRGTVSGGSVSPPVEAPPAPEVAPLELQPPEEKALEDRYALEFTLLSERQDALEAALDALRAQEAELDQELRRYLYQPKIAGALAGKLRGVQEQLERREEELEQVRGEIQELLTRAAGRGVTVRRLPSGGGI